MNLDNIISQVLTATGTFTPQIALVLFLVCAIGEFGFSIPYLLETVWLLAGYQVARGILPIVDLILFWVIAQIGRQTGAAALFFCSHFGFKPLLRIYNKFFTPKLKGKSVISTFVQQRLTNLSPFSIALGRLMGLRIPLTLTLGAQKKWPLLSLGVLISSVIWDGIYLVLSSIVGIAAAPKPVNMFFYSLIGLTALYLMNILIRLFTKGRPEKASSSD